MKFQGIPPLWNFIYKRVVMQGSLVIRLAAIVSNNVLSRKIIIALIGGAGEVRRGAMQAQLLITSVSFI